MPEPPPVIRETTASNFLKDRTGLRVGEGAVDLFVELFTTMAEAIATTAVQVVAEEERTTVLDRDIQYAFDKLFSDPHILGPDAIHTAIDAVSNQGLSQLIQLLRADVATLIGTPP